MKRGKSNTETRSSKLSVTKKPAKGVGRSKAVAKDPNKPKRPANFRETFKKENPKDKSAATVSDLLASIYLILDLQSCIDDEFHWMIKLKQVGKAVGDKWKSLSDAEKAHFVTKAEKRKVGYKKNMKVYNKKLEEGPKEDEESDKSVSEVNDEDDAEDGSDEEEAGAYLGFI